MPRSNPISSSAIEAVPFKENRRKIEHVLPLGFAFTLTIFPLWIIFILALTAVLYGALISGRYFLATATEAERKKGYSVSKTAYGVSVLVLLILFHRQMHIVAGAWAIMALGDSAASVAGKKWGTIKLPWNHEKSLVGMIAFFLFGTAGCFGLMWYTTATGDYSGAPSIVLLIAGALVTSGISALGESLDSPIDDNITVPMLAGLTLYLCSPMMGL